MKARTLSVGAAFAMGWATLALGQDAGTMKESPFGAPVRVRVVGAAPIQGAIVGRLPNALVVRSPCVSPWCQGDKPKVDTVAFTNIRAMFYRARPPIPVNPVTGAIGGAVIGGALGFAGEARLHSRGEVVGSRAVLGALTGVSVGYLLQVVWPGWRRAW